MTIKRLTFLLLLVCTIGVASGRKDQENSLIEIYLPLNVHCDSAVLRVHEFSQYFDLGTDTTYKCTKQQDKLLFHINSKNQYKNIDLLFYYKGKISERSLIQYVLEPETQIKITFTNKAILFGGAGRATWEIQKHMYDIAKHYLRSSSTEDSTLYASVTRYMSLMDDIELAQEKYLLECRNSLSPYTLKYLKAEIELRCEIGKMKQLKYYYNHSQLDKDIAQIFGNIDTNKKYFLLSRILKTRDTLNVNISQAFPDYVIGRLMLDSSIFVNRSPNLSSCYNYIKDNFNKDVRDQIILRFLYACKEGTEYSIDRRAYSFIVHKALDDLNPGLVKNAVLKLSKSYLPGQPAPDFRLIDSNGKVYTKAHFKGQPLLVDLWFTGCGNCVRVVPFLDKIEKSFSQKGIKFLSICIDTDTAMWKTSLISRKYTTDQALNLFSERQNGIEPITSFYHITGCPTFLLIDKYGNYQSMPIDPRTDNGSDMIKEINELLE